MADSADVLGRFRAAEEKLWIPGVGEVNPRVTAAQRVIKDYDERLELVQHQLTGDWVVCIRVSQDNLYPVIGLGPEIPANAEDLRQRLWRADAQRHGDKLLKQINEHNRRIQLEARSRALEADEAVAEHLEWGFRREGVISPQVFIPRDL